ncbi:NADH-ubiquinone dehydrogenase [Pseudaminobacter sp. NGMCC 1.201702]|uniref:NADH-ubiquinone dehydrogenase n=1 Tax=Pseudaminobacter sp. NGMCC 1.201702 TaxID=3391825 RepID=UPI0039F0DAEE
MKNDPTFDMPSDMASAVNLIAHPLAGAAAMTALGLGLASQTIGVWMGAMAGMAQASQQVFSSLADEAGVAAPKAAMSAKRSRPALKVVKREAGAGFSRPTSIDRPDAPDDLKAISGIGPKLEQVLNGLGVWTHSQIAAWGAREAGWLDDYLGLQGRIDRDGWVAQAARLATEKTKH